MSEDSFDLEAGDISLDFANTNNWHASDHPIENLHGYADLVAWGKAAGVISPAEVEQLTKVAIKQPEDARRAYEFAIQTREAIYRIFSHRYAGKPIREEDLDALNAVVSVAMSNQQLVPLGDEFRWEWKVGHDGANRIIWNVAIAAARLLTSDKVSRVRVCEDDRGCGYLFIDMSKNHSRRWCSMESCGNRAKAKRHYSRNKIEEV